MTEPAPKTRKGAETRDRIVQAALELFESRGYDETTMRDVADRAGVAVGNAYYYFRSKELLLQAYYRELNARVAAAVADVLATERGFEARLRGVLLRKLDVIEPYHRFSAVLFRTAADPASPQNPFSDESRAMREDGIALYRDVLAGSRTKVPGDLAARLPELLWTFDLGVVLFWIHDRTPGRRRTRALIEHSAGLVARLVRLAANPLLAPLRRRAVRLLEELAADGAAAADPSPGA
ncbi:MAG: TetR family transcriptional regulator [Planctomycetes bacterium]|nr:TetR family transcriptional regulator [Planctomycetota bacterium]